MGRLVALAIVAACGADPVPCPHLGPFDDCDVIACHRALACDIFCTDGSTCPPIDCTDAMQCRLLCNNGSTCDDIDCRGAEQCYADCTGATSCGQTCDGADSCTMTCNDGVPCLLDCGSALDCRFFACSDDSGPVEPLRCANGVLACNRPCP